ncbi:6875_t:CDS:2 [Funneliformis geosporum]|uniref:U three protein 23 n=1 Tax=Funneliformis geosporum TaxID=1117311 RepID=A0A9W4WVW5_9GLOM|nr:6875_t:CDS:2 [Funneliformis geosporum]CAI2176055.1 13677_t:CDS:2 [Funneliformis geosporum]
MRPKRTKQYKRLMALYSASFGFREPYQILVDGDFVQTALRYKMDLYKQLCTVMLGNTKQMYTSCTLAEIKKLGKDEFGTVTALSNLERRGCIHRHNPVSSAECIASIIETDNPNNYCVATQNGSLRERFRVVPGVPLLYINRSVLIIEPPSYATIQKAKQVESAKTYMSAEELSFLTKTNSDTAKRQAGAEKPKKKRKGPKQPNPLSCKKKRIKVVPQRTKNEIKEPTNKKRAREDDHEEHTDLNKEVNNENQGRSQMQTTRNKKSTRMIR